MTKYIGSKTEELTSLRAEIWILKLKFTNNAVDTLSIRYILFNMYICMYKRSWKYSDLNLNYLI